MGLRDSRGGFAPSAPAHCFGRTLPPRIDGTTCFLGDASHMLDLKVPTMQKNKPRRRWEWVFKGWVQAPARRHLRGQFGPRWLPRVFCEPSHPQFNTPFEPWRESPPSNFGGAVGANPPQESLRPMYRHGEATLESSGPKSRTHRRCKRHPCEMREARNLSGPRQSGEEPHPCHTPQGAAVPWSSS